MRPETGINQTLKILYIQLPHTKGRKRDNWQKKQARARRKS